LAPLVEEHKETLEHAIEKHHLRLLGKQELKNETKGEINEELAGMGSKDSKL